jgi:hypothetical protein
VRSGIGSAAATPVSIAIATSALIPLIRPHGTAPAGFGAPPSQAGVHRIAIVRARHPHRYPLEDYRRLRRLGLRRVGLRRAGLRARDRVDFLAVVDLAAVRVDFAAVRFAVDERLRAPALRPPFLIGAWFSGLP